MRRHPEYIGRKGDVELHTDDAHPNVNVVLKAMSEQGTRLNIKKAHLKEWRVKFADHLRELGVAANATPRNFRGSAERPIRLALHWRNKREDGRAPVPVTKPIRIHESRTR